MKKWIVVLCALLLLTGCGKELMGVSVVTYGENPPVDAGPAAPLPEPAPEPEPTPPPEPDAGPGLGAAVDPAPDPGPPDPKQETVAGLLAEMTLEEKVGQLFFARCPDAGAAEDIGAWHLGGYLLFTRDFKDSAGEWLSEQNFTQKILDYQEVSAVPLLIGVDEEGGTVARASRNPNLFAEKYKSPQKVFSMGGMEAIALDAVDKNRDLLRYGINVNFAPVADVSTDPADFMYDRAFGQDARATAEYVEAVVTAAGGVSVSNGDGVYKIGAVLKHFPGYGDNRDTHTGVAIDRRGYEQFLEEDFLPFRAGIEAGAGSVLVSHNVVECMDPDLPASLSPEVHRLLREELGFTGVVLTDDLAMDAVKAYAREGSAAVLAVLAGNDMIVTTDYAGQIPQVIDGVKTGLIDAERIDQAVERVLRWKYDLGLFGGIYD